MKKLSSLAMILVAAPVLFVLVGADDKEKKCPISGQPVKEGHSLNVNGKAVGFCCDKCPEAYKKKLNIVNADEKPGVCPMDKKTALASHAVIESTAEKVYFCCGNCPTAFNKKNKFEAKDAGPKTCPVSGQPAKAAEGTSLLINAEKVYFCCDKCPKGYQKDKLGVVDKGPAKCPVSGKPAVAEESEILVKSKMVYFCCEACAKGYAEKTFKDGKVIPSDKPAAAEPKK